MNRLNITVKNAISNKVRALFYWWHFTRIQAHQKSNLSNRTLSENQVNLLFITGFDKSGTTWLMKLLNGHPDIYCHSAGQFFNYYIPGVHFLNQPGGYQTMAQNIVDSSWYKGSGHIWIPEDSVYAMSKQLIIHSMGSFIQDKQKIVGDKSVVQDCPLIRKLFPEARIIAIMRDGRDVAVSFAYHFLRRGNANKFTKGSEIEPGYLQAVSKSWSKYNEHLLDYAVSGDDKFFLVKYEELKAESNNQLTKIFDFLDVPAEPKLTEKIINNNSFKILSGGREPGEADNDSSFRKGIVGDWKNHFSEKEIEIFMENAAHTLHRAGFPV